LTALTEAAAAITSTLDLNSILQTVARLAGAVTHAEASNVFLLDERRRRLTVVAATGHRRDALVGREFEAGLGMPGEVLRTCQPVNLANVRLSPKFCVEIDDISSLRTQTLLAVPMIHRAQVIGVIEVVNRLDERPFAPEDVKILQLFAALAAGATQNARAHEELKRRFAGLQASVMKEIEIIGESPRIRSAIELCNKVAPSTATVLIVGESGTGKELAARYIHRCSQRRDGAFIAINCAALTETLLESELFGHEKGAFTGAQVQRAGCFEAANEGTLFLDEIGEISKSMQAKLLRVLQEKEIVRVGGTKAIPCNVRIIAATNRNLKEMMTRGDFREDLYYRLSVFPIELPALRERPEDIPLLVKSFVERAFPEGRGGGLAVSAEAMAVLKSYAWPGNIRELQNVLERAILMCEGDALLPEHLPIDLAAGNSKLVGDFSSRVEPQVETRSLVEHHPAVGEAPGHGTLRGMERMLILKALEQAKWNQSEAARLLGISRDLLRHRLRKYAIQKPAEKQTSRNLPA